MKAKNFLFTAVLTFGAILFATNVSGQTTNVTTGTGTATGGSIEGTVSLVLKLKDFQELKVNGGSSTVEFTYNSRDDYSESDAAVAKAPEQLTAFSTKKFNIYVRATEFKSGTVTLPTEVLDMFTITATNKGVGSIADTPVTLGTTDKRIFSDSQSKTTNSDGYKIDIDYSLVNPKAILEAMGETDIVKISDETLYNEYTSTVIYTIIPG
jgi:hypothetical protein